MAQCNKCNTKDPNLIYYWHGDIEEDYDMGDYDCLCENCFNQSMKWIVWVGGVDDYYVHYADAKRDYDNWIDKGYDNVVIEEIKSD